jgi:polygalacturonase
MILSHSLASLLFRSVITLTLTLISTVTVTVSAHSFPIFDITTYGAISDNTTLCTSSIQAAIDAAYAIGGGIVFIPSGGAFRTATISLRDNVYLHLPAGATIQASSLLADYVSINGPNWDLWDVIHSKNVTNTGILSEGGVLQGPMWQLIDHYDPIQNQLIPKTFANGLYGCIGECRPRLLVFEDCSNVLIKGLVLKDSADWTQLYRRVVNVTLDSLIVFGSQQWPNNDGVDFESCIDVVVRNWTSFTGDDGIVFGSGNCNTMKTPWPEPYGNYTPTRNVLIDGAIISSYSSAIKFEQVFQSWHGDVYNITLQNILIHDSARGIGFQQRTGGGKIYNINIQNVSVFRTKGVTGSNWWGLGEALWITSLPEEDAASNSSLGGIDSITFTNLYLEGEQGIIIINRGQGDATIGKITGLLFKNTTVVVGIFGNATRQGVHDLRPLSKGEQILSANVTGFWFESILGGVLQNSKIQFIGQDQPFWNPPSNCVGMTSDSTIQISNINCIRPMLEEPLNDEVEEIPDSLDEETV